MCDIKAHNPSNDFMLRFKFKVYYEDYVKLSSRYVTNEFNIDFDVC